jgi:hypothetical protein
VTIASAGTCTSMMMFGPYGSQIDAVLAWRVLRAAPFAVVEVAVPLGFPDVRCFCARVVVSAFRDPASQEPPVGRR